MSNPLAAYLESESISDADFGILVSRDRSIISKLRSGTLKASPELALEIERQTDGRVDAALLNPIIAAARGGIAA